MVIGVFVRARFMGSTFLWRGSLLPLEAEGLPMACPVCNCCAAEREQAPSHKISKARSGAGHLSLQRPAQRHEQFHDVLRIQSLRHFYVHVVFLVMVWPGESGQKLFVLGGLSCKKDPSYSARENSLLIPSRQTHRIVFCVISICFNGI